MSDQVLWFSGLGMGDVPRVGGKNASLGEMVSNLAGAGITVPDGFATTADAFRAFLEFDGLDQKIYNLLDGLDVEDVKRLQTVGAEIRDLVVNHPLPQQLDDAGSLHAQSGCQAKQTATAVPSLLPSLLTVQSSMI